MSMVVLAQDWEQDYNATITKVCQELWLNVLNSVSTLVDENGIALRINVADLCNTMTQVAQAYRAANAQ